MSYHDKCCTVLNFRPELVRGTESEPAPELRFPEPTDVAGYTLSEYDAAMVNALRLGNAPLPIAVEPVRPGQVCTALLVGPVGRTTANLRVVVDGIEDYWVTSRNRGREPGHWYLEGDPA